MEVSLQEEPQVGTIVLLQDSSYFQEKGLEFSECYAQKTPDLSITLSSNVINATKAYWQYSEDNVNWETLSFPIKIGIDTTLAISVKDSFPVRYYRLVIENQCGIEYSEGFKLITLNDVPPILEKHVQVVQKALCLGDECQIRIGDYLNYSDQPTCSGDYAYRVKGYDDIYLHLKKYTEGELIRPKGDFVLTLKNVTQPIELTIERVSEKTGITSIITYSLDFELFEADFEFSVLTQNNEIRYNASADNVEIEQGALVQFFNTTEQKLQSIGWLLIDSKDYEEESNIDLSAKGLYSYKDSPLSYFYNGGRYTVTMYAISEFGCKDTVRSSALYIPWESVRSIENGAGFFEDEVEIEEWIEQHQISEPVVYPSLFDSWIKIHYPEQRFRYTLYDEVGRKLIEGEGESSLELHLEYLYSGNYVLEVAEHRFKLVKISN